MQGEEAKIKIAEKEKFRFNFDPTPHNIQIADLARETGGHSTKTGTGGIANAIIDRLKTHEDKKLSHYQIMLIVDSSGSMQNSLEWLQIRLGNIYSFAKSQLKEGGEVSISVRYYVDKIYDDKGELVPLDGVEELERRKEADLKNPPGLLKELFANQEVKEAQRGIDTITKNLGGGIEYHWEAAMNAMDNEPWAPELSDNEPVGKVIFLITDEGDDGGTNILNHTKDEVVAAARERGIRFEHILEEEEEEKNDPWSVFSPY